MLPIGIVLKSTAKDLALVKMPQASDLVLDEQQLATATVGLVQANKDSLLSEAHQDHPSQHRQRGEVWLLTWLSNAEKALQTLPEVCIMHNHSAALLSRLLMRRDIARHDCRMSFASTPKGRKLPLSRS